MNEIKNEPLTLKQLKKMNNERVFVQFENGPSMYGLVAYHKKFDEYYDVADGENVWITNNHGGRSSYKEIINTGGKVYRDKPTTGQGERNG